MTRVNQFCETDSSQKNKALIALHLNFKDQGLLVSQEIFKVFFISDMRLCKTSDDLGGVILVFFTPELQC